MNGIKYLKAKLRKLDAADKKVRARFDALKDAAHNAELRANRAWDRLYKAEDESNAFVSQWLEVNEILERKEKNAKRTKRRKKNA